MQGMSNKCGRESCRFCETGKCTDQEQRSKRLGLLNRIIPNPEDRIKFALSDQLIKDY
jgi:hypothetical protein